jgi:ABC-type bacteriocin/lantibiotic exporter with double-glycine peptidase domain
VVYVYGAQQCIQQGLSVGKFSALVKVFSRIGGRVVRISDILIKMQRGCEGLGPVAELLNKPVGGVEEADTLQPRCWQQAQADFARARTAQRAVDKFKSLLDRDVDHAPGPGAACAGATCARLPPEMVVR